MVNKCLVINCASGYATGEKRPSLLSPKGQEFRIKWVYFVNHKDVCLTWMFTNINRDRIKDFP